MYDVGRAANGYSFDVGHQANARWSVECWSLHYSSCYSCTLIRYIIRGLRLCVVLERHEAPGAAKVTSVARMNTRV